MAKRVGVATPGAQRPSSGKIRLLRPPQVKCWLERPLSATGLGPSTSALGRSEPTGLPIWTDWSSCTTRAASKQTVDIAAIGQERPVASGRFADAFEVSGAYSFRRRSPPCNA